MGNQRLFVSVTKDTSVFKNGYKILKTNTDLVRVGEIASERTIELIKAKGIEIARFTLVNTRYGRLRWRRTYTAQEKKELSERRDVHWKTRIENIPGRLPFPEEFGFSSERVGNCGVVALAIVTKMPYEFMHEYFRKMSRNPGKWKGVTYSSTYGNTMSKFGVNFTLVDVGYRALQVKQFVEQYTKPKTTYLVCTSNHAMVIRSGYVIDQRGAIPVNRMDWGQRSVIIRVWEIKDGPTKI